MAPAMSKAIVAYDQFRPVYIYKVIDRRTNRVIYVGQSVDVSRRWKQHAMASSKCPYLQEQMQKAPDMLKYQIVNRLPRGVPKCRADEFEAYYVFFYNTVYHPTHRPDGCNAQLPPHSQKMNYEAVRAELKKGFEWPEVEANEAVPLEVAKAVAREAMLADLVSIADDKVPESLSTALTVATMERMQIERQFMGALEFAKDLRDEYADNYDDAIDRNDFAVHLNLLNEKIREDDEGQAIEKMVSALLFANKPEREFEMTSKAAAHGFGFVYEMLYARDDARRLAKLQWTLKTRSDRHGKKDDPVVKNQILAVRKWSRTHGDAKPMDTSVDPEEKRHGGFLNHWKGNNDIYGGEKTDLASCRVVMRDLPWFDEFADSKKASAEALDTLITQLVGGAAIMDKEPEFDEVETRTPLFSSKGNLKVYQKYLGMLRGEGSDADVTKVVNALEANGQPKRAAWIRKTYGEARPVLLERRKESYEKRRNTKREAADDTAQGSSSKKVKTDEVKNEDEEDEDEEDD